MKNNIIAFAMGWLPAATIVLHECNNNGLFAGIITFWVITPSISKLLNRGGK